MKRTDINKHLVDIGYKKCNLCGEILPIVCFSKNKNRIGGINDECKKCVNQRNTNRYHSKRFPKEKLKAYYKHSIKLGLQMNITETDLENLWEQQNGMCFYTHLPMTTNSGMINTVSVDRIDNNKGYVISNVCLCCDYVNYIKSTLNYSEVIEILKLIINNQNQELLNDQKIKDPTSIKWNCKNSRQPMNEMTNPK